jgi:beta-N-acetylhexosaminidase
VKRILSCAALSSACLLLGGCGFLSLLPPAGAQSPGIPAETAQAAQLCWSDTVPGTVYGATADTITLVTDDRQLFTFSTDGAAVTAPEGGVRAGYPVEVEIAGVPDSSAPTRASRVDISDFSGLTAAQEAARLLLTMSVSDEVGQMFLTRCPTEGAAGMQSQYQFGGYVLYADFFGPRSADEVISDVQSCQAASKIPMVIAVDEEGGPVNRVSLYGQFRSAPFASPQTLYAQGGFDAVTADTREKCALLKALGINVNLSPVCDVSTNASDFMYSRSFGQDAELTSQYVQTVVGAMSGSGVGCVLKHFPGYGNNADTHTGVAVDDRPYSTFEDSDFLPFEAGLRAGAGAVLVCHNVVNCLDGASPASLSAAVHDILRGDLGFGGVIITDDLNMDAIRDYSGGEAAAVLAVKAGNDMLCCTDCAGQYEAVLAAVQSGEISRERLDESVLRILEWKIDLGILA